MRYFVIAGEASGDLHAGHLIEAIRRADASAEIRYWYRPDLAYMGFVPVLLHLRSIFRGMKECRRAISEFCPDRLILVDYPGFNLKIASWFRRYMAMQAQSAPEAKKYKIVYYIPPKVWAWKEGRMKRIRSDVDMVLSILPFEVEWYLQRHAYHVDYVGNPTLDEIDSFLKCLGAEQVAKWRTGLSLGSEPILAMMPGSRRDEISRNLPLMIRAAHQVGGDVQYVVASAPNIEESFYHSVIAKTVGEGMDDSFRNRIVLAPCLGSNSSFLLLHSAHAALVTSGTATLETAIMGVPQVVCYAMRCGKLVSMLRRVVLKVPFVSLVNLIADTQVVPELIAGDCTLQNLTPALSSVLFDESYRARQLRGYDQVMQRLGQPGAPERAARLLVEE